MNEAGERGRVAGARGRARETKLARKLEEEGWIVASRRHYGGAGDLLAARNVGPKYGPLKLTRRDPAVWLIEVKSTAKPYERFGPAKRRELREAAHAAGAEAVLAHWPKGARGVRMIFESAWPA